MSTACSLCHISEIRAIGAIARDVLPTLPERSQFSFLPASPPRSAAPVYYVTVCRKSAPSECGATRCLGGREQRERHVEKVWPEGGGECIITANVRANIGRYDVAVIVGCNTIRIE